MVVEVEKTVKILTTAVYQTINKKNARLSKIIRAKVTGRKQLYVFFFFFIIFFYKIFLLQHGSFRACLEH